MPDGNFPSQRSDSETERVVKNNAPFVKKIERLAVPPGRKIKVRVHIALYSVILQREERCGYAFTGLSLHERVILKKERPGSTSFSGYMAHICG